MAGREWRRLDPDALERLLIERWLQRGMMLGVLALSAAIALYLGARGISSLTDQVALAVVLLLGGAAAFLAVAMRHKDLRIHKDLRRRPLGSSDRPPR